MTRDYPVGEQEAFGKAAADQPRAGDHVIRRQLAQGAILPGVDEQTVIQPEAHAVIPIRPVRAAILLSRLNHPASIV